MGRRRRGGEVVRSVQEGCVRMCTCICVHLSRNVTIYTCIVDL